ncbi:MAG: FHA domain-containing protein [Prevotella sp.]|nr:FHA domain-containing protein [Prevotella sp.]MBR1767474.1 FHA domain-containing protein [Prevotella sp.]
MIICPTCREEIDGDSHFCDQCGQALLYCNQCGHVGIGRRCTRCGGLMVAPSDQNGSNNPAMSASLQAEITQGTLSGNSIAGPLVQERPASSGVPVLTLANDSLNIRIVGINGAVIGRRKGPYTQFFEQHAYVSGVHAQLKYKSGSGWVITDKHSSNGTKVNQRPLQPDVDMALHNGDILTIANVNLQVIVR